MGPWRPTSDGKVLHNPYRWSKLANMVYLEQPVGVGFSYDDSNITSSNNNIGNIKYGDYNAVTDMVRAMVVFFQKYPERNGNTIYIASESYGGHYIPELSLALLNKLKLPTNTTTPAWSAEWLSSIFNRFNGFIVGNPYVSFSSGEIAGASTAWGFQILPKALWNEFKSNNCSLLGSNPYEYSDACWNLLGMIDEQIQDGGGQIMPLNSSGLVKDIDRKLKTNSSVGEGGGLNICKFPLSECGHTVRPIERTY